MWSLVRKWKKQDHREYFDPILHTTLPYIILYTKSNRWLINNIIRIYTPKVKVLSKYKWKETEPLISFLIICNPFAHNCEHIKERSELIYPERESKMMIYLS